jgi:hypothetical protein
MRNPSPFGLLMVQGRSLYIANQRIAPKQAKIGKLQLLGVSRMQI